MLHESTWLAGVKIRFPGLIQELNLEHSEKELEVFSRDLGLEVSADERRTAITLSRDENGIMRLHFISPLGLLDSSVFYSDDFQSAIFNFSDPCIAMKNCLSGSDSLLVAYSNFPLMGFVAEEIDALAIRFFAEKKSRLSQLQAETTDLMELPESFSATADDWSEKMRDLLEELGGLPMKRI